MNVSLSGNKRRIANLYLELGRDSAAVAEKLRITNAQVLWVLRSPEAREIVGEQDVIEEMFAALTNVELGMEYLQALRQMKGEEEVPMPVVDRDGNVTVHMVRKYHAADVRAILADLAKIAGLTRPTEVNINMKTVTFDMSGIEDEPEPIDAPVEDVFPALTSPASDPYLDRKSVV